MLNLQENCMKKYLALLLALCLMLSRRDNVSDADANANHANVE